MLVAVASPKTLTIKDLMRWLEERIAKCEETLRIIQVAELQHPQHINLKGYYMKRTAKELKDLKESLEHLRKVSEHAN